MRLITNILVFAAAYTITGCKKETEKETEKEAEDEVDAPSNEEDDEPNTSKQQNGENPPSKGCSANKSKLNALLEQQQLELDKQQKEIEAVKASIGTCKAKSAELGASLGSMEKSKLLKRVNRGVKGRDKRTYVDDLVSLKREIAVLEKQKKTGDTSEQSKLDEYRASFKSGMDQLAGPQSVKLLGEMVEEIEAKKLSSPEEASLDEAAGILKLIRGQLSHRSRKSFSSSLGTDEEAG